jgi:hypothetical protein
MSKRCHRVLTRALVAAVVTATMFGSASAAAGGPPQGGGGCHMVFSPSSIGLDQMMAGSGASRDGDGVGAEKMGDMLSRFSDQPFCGPEQ